VHRTESSWGRPIDKRKQGGGNGSFPLLPLGEEREGRSLEVGSGVSFFFVEGAGEVI